MCWILWVKVGSQVSVEVEIIVDGVILLGSDGMWTHNWIPLFVQNVGSPSMNLHRVEAQKNDNINLTCIYLLNAESFLVIAIVRSYIYKTF